MNPVRVIGIAGFGALVALPGCAAGPVRYVSVPPPTAQALSLLGDTLWNLALDPEEGQRRIRLLFKARDEAADNPHNLNAKILLARRTVDVGRLREAVGIYTEAIGENPVDLRLPRRRGEVLLQLRELDLAVGDLTRAARGALLRATELEFNDLPDGSGLFETTLQHSSLFFLAMAFYLKGDFTQAREIHVQALKRARNADEVAKTSLWLFFATRRLGQRAEAAAVLGSIRPDMPVSMAAPEHQLLLAYRGDIPEDSLPVNLREPLRTEADAIFGYGIGFALLMQGREEEAGLAFQQVRATPNWTALSFLSAEAELAWMRRSKP